LWLRKWKIGIGAGNSPESLHAGEVMTR